MLLSDRNPRGPVLSGRIFHRSAGSRGHVQGKHPEEDTGFVGRKAEDRHDDTLQVCSSGRKTWEAEIEFLLVS